MSNVSKAILPPYFYNITVMQKFDDEEVSENTITYLFHNPDSARKSYFKQVEVALDEMANPKNNKTASIVISMGIYSDPATKVTSIAHTTVYPITRVKTLRKATTQRR